MSYTTEGFVKALGKSFFALAFAFFMWKIFDSLFLALLSLAFFFYIPFQREDAEMEINSVIFTILMIVVLVSAFSGGLGIDMPSLGLGWITFGISIILVGFRIAAGVQKRFLTEFPPGIVSLIAISLFGLTLIFGKVWTWSASAIVFVGIWFLAFFIGGLSGDIESRQVVGALMILVSFFIFSVGIGMHQVGSAFFGEWWPTVYKFGEGVFGPLWNAFSQFKTTFGMGFELITNPSAFAQRILSGQFATDPTTGLKGAYGVEILDVRTTPIVVEQPFSVMVKIQNKGAMRAKNVVVFLLPGLKRKAPGSKQISLLETYEEIMKVARFRNGSLYLEKDPELKDVVGDLESLGFRAKANINCTRHVCWTNIGDLEKVDIRQIFFDSEGLGCKEVVENNLRKKPIQLRVLVAYDYGVSSSLQMEFVSEEEWTRKVQQGEFVPRMKKPATLTNAPAMLNLGTLEQPIKEGTPFYIGAVLEPGPRGGSIYKANISMKIPRVSIFNNSFSYCSPQGYQYKETNSSTILNWTFKPKQNLMLYCSFGGKKDMAEPSRTFIVTANASYTFLKDQPITGVLEFGGIYCCESDEDCEIKGEGLKCIENKCEVPM